MRRYWLPALLSEEIPGADCPPVRVKLMGEKLVAFRDTGGRIGLLDEFCPTGWRRCSWGETKTTVFVVCSMDGSSTLRGGVWT
jgi:phenylpropionate dioxygenase-like ring-hydroxylating dioxygenase large terminal subunit